MYDNKLMLLLGAGLLLTACSSENGEDQTPDEVPTPTCNTADVTYALTVAPLLQKNCTSCHNSSFANGAVNLSSYAQVRTVALSGRLIGAVNHEAGYSPMPKGGTKLAECDISQLRKWVTEGAANN